MYGGVPRGGAFDLVVLAASQGGLAAGRQVLAALPAQFPAAVLLLVHRPGADRDRLPGLLARHVQLPVGVVQAGRRPRPGTIYVAPGDRQLVLDAEGAFATVPLQGRLAQADPLLHSVAAAGGSRTIAAVLTGRMADGAAGIQAVKRAGGRVLVQDQATAEQFGMPAAAIATGCVDFVLPLATIAPAIIALTMAPGAAVWLRVPVPPWASTPQPPPASPRLVS